MPFQWGNLPSAGSPNDHLRKKRRESLSHIPILRKVFPAFFTNCIKE